MADYTDLMDRIDLLEARAKRSPADHALLSEIEDVLSEGYIEALSGEARSRRIAMRLERLAETLSTNRGAAVEARRLALERRSLDQKLVTLRRRLAVFREQFIRLGGGRTTPN